MHNISCYDLVNEYMIWLKENITVSELENACEITTPFVDRHNDFLQIYLTNVDGKYYLTDDGYILNDLLMSGVDINTDKRKELLQTILNGYGIELKDKELKVSVTKKDYPLKKHLLIQSMLAINDLYLVSQSKVLSFFMEDVERFLNLKKIRFLPNINFIGKSGYSHSFDFAIPKSGVAPERIIKAINSPSRDNVSSLIFSWNDTRETRSIDSQAIVFLNDQESTISYDSLTALESYDIQPIFWTKREDSVELLNN